MLPFNTFTKIVPFFLYGFKYGGHRHPDKSYRILKPTVFVLSYSQYSFDKLRFVPNALNVYFPNENFYIDAHPDLNNDKQLKNFEKAFKTLTNSAPDYLQKQVIKEMMSLDIDELKSKLGEKFEPKLNILNFKIHSETHIDDPTKWYYVSIGIFGTNKVKPYTPTMVYCSCPDFRYTFSYVLYHHGALLYDEEFPEIFKTVPPKKRNPYLIPWGCKHIYTISRMIYENKDKFIFSEDFVKKFNIRNNPTQSRPNLGLIIQIEDFIQKIKRMYKNSLNIFFGKKK